MYKHKAAAITEDNLEPNLLTGNVVETGKAHHKVREGLEIDTWQRTAWHHLKVSCLPYPMGGLALSK